MDELLFKALSTYYDTIFKSGYMPENKVKELLVLDFLTELMTDPDYYLEANLCEQGIANTVLNCLKENNCLIELI